MKDQTNGRQFGILITRECAMSEFASAVAAYHPEKVDALAFPTNHSFTIRVLAENALQAKATGANTPKLKGIGLGSFAVEGASEGAVFTKAKDIEVKAVYGQIRQGMLAWYARYGVTEAAFNTGFRPTTAFLGNGKELQPIRVAELLATTVTLETRDGIVNAIAAVGKNAYYGTANSAFADFNWAPMFDGEAAIASFSKKGGMILSANFVNGNSAQYNIHREKFTPGEKVTAFKRLTAMGVIGIINRAAKNGGHAVTLKANGLGVKYVPYALAPKSLRQGWELDQKYLGLSVATI